MGDRVDALENRMGVVDNTLAELVTQMQNQCLVLAKLSEQMARVGQKEMNHEGDTSTNNSIQS
ncbi:hypothetical protein A2U01_0111131, partial [Trifolium medium]|nr:hypothetical protein [Trifolium medium]